MCQKRDVISWRVLLVGLNTLIFTLVRQKATSMSTESTQGTLLPAATEDR